MATPETALESTHRERRRAVKVANERAKANATMLTQLGSAMVIAGIIAPMFTNSGLHVPTILLTVLGAGLLYSLANLILSVMDLED